MGLRVGLLALVMATSGWAGDRLSVLQFNVWQEGTKVEGGFDKLVEIVAASKADVVTFSEVRNYQKRDFTQRVLKALAEKGKTYHGRFVGSDVSIISRYPLKSVELLPGGMVMARVEPTKTHAVYVVAAHLDYRNYAVYLPRGYSGKTWKMLDPDKDGKPNPVTELEQLHAMDAASERDEQWDAFYKAIQSRKLGKANIIVAGDFNEASHLDWTEATKNLFDHNGVVIGWRNSVRLYEAGFKDSWRELYPDPVTHPGFTWPSAAFGKKSTSWTPKADERERIDYVYYRGAGLKPVASKLVGSCRLFVRNVEKAIDTQCPTALTELPWPSDHLGIMTEFELVE